MSGSANAPVMLIAKAPQPGFPDSYALTQAQTTVGRHPSNNIVLPFESISRFHARVDRRGDYYIVQDLNSSNGTFVNNERVTQMTIHHGDSVTFGNVDFVFQNENSQSGLSTNSGAGKGKDIVDILDDSSPGGGTQPPVSTSVLKADEISKEKSSVISALTDRKADRNALLRLNQRLRALYGLSEMLREAGGETEQSVLAKVLELLFDAVQADRAVILTRFAADAQQLDVSAVKYRDAPIVNQKVTVSRTILEQVMREKVAILSKDAQQDERFGASESIIMNQVRSTICVPMTMNNVVMGVLFLDTSSTSRSFNEEDLEFATIVATEASVAIDNMRMRAEAVHRSRLAAVGETVAGISHNVKNILLLSQGGGELLSRALETGDTESAREAWGVVKRGIDKIGALVRDMLEYSSNKSVELRSIDINDMVCGIAEEVEKKLVEKNIMLELDLDESLPPKLIDHLGTQRTIYNLIVNAMEAIKHNEGRIILTTLRKPDGRVIITVRDNGCGIPKDKLERVWFPFFTTKGSSGTGLGLPMCKKCIEDMGGTMKLESEENVGTVFTIEIPAEVKGASGLTTQSDDEGH